MFFCLLFDSLSTFRKLVFFSKLKISQSDKLLISDITVYTLIMKNL